MSDLYLANFGLFVSPVKGHLVRRFGTSTTIGARVLSEDERRLNPQAEPIAWELDRVIPITHDEMVRYGREYALAIERGELKARTEDDFVAATRTEEAREARADADRKASEAKMAEADRMAKQPIPAALGKKSEPKETV